MLAACGHYIVPFDLHLLTFGSCQRKRQINPSNFCAAGVAAEGAAEVVVVGAAMIAVGGVAGDSLAWLLQRLTVSALDCLHVSPVLGFRDLLLLRRGQPRGRGRGQKRQRESDQDGGGYKLAKTD